MEAQCPLLAAKLAQAPAPATLRIANGRPVKAEPPKAQGHAFQLTAKEARATLNVVTGMFLSSISFIKPTLCLSIVPVIRYVFSELLAYIGFI